MKKYIIFGLIFAALMIVWSLVISPQLLDDQTFVKHPWHAFIVWPLTGQVIGYFLYRIQAKKSKPVN